MLNMLERLKKLKEDSQLTSAQIAEISKVPLSSVNRIMSGQTENPTFESIAAIVKALDGSLDEIAGITKKGVHAPPSDSIITAYQEIIAAKNDKYNDMVAAKDDKYNDMVIAKDDKYNSAKENYEKLISANDLTVKILQKWFKVFCGLLLIIFLAVVIYLVVDASNPAWGIFRS